MYPLWIIIELSIPELWEWFIQLRRCSFLYIFKIYCFIGIVSLSLIRVMFSYRHVSNKFNIVLNVELPEIFNKTNSWSRKKVLLTYSLLKGYIRIENSYFLNSRENIIKDWNNTQIWLVNNFHWAQRHGKIRPWRSTFRFRLFIVQKISKIFLH